MPDFNNLYNPDLGKDPVQVPSPNLNEISDPFKGYDPDQGINHVDVALSNLDNKLFKPTTDRILQPVGYDADTLNADRYRHSSYMGELGFNPFSNNEERYGNRQTNWNKLGNAFGGMWHLIRNQFVEQAGSWGDTLSFLKDNKSAFEQADIDEINKQQKELLTEHPIFETAAQRDSIWNFNTIANTVQQSGYAVGAVTEIAAEELAMTMLTSATFGATGELQAARTAKLAASIGAVLQKTKQIEEGFNTASRLRKIFEVINKVNPLLDNTLEFAGNLKNISRIDKIAFGGSKLATARTVARGFGSLYRDVREFNAAIAEAKGEAASSYQDLKGVLTDQYRKDHNGKDPAGADAQRIQDTAMGAAQTNGVANTYLIMLSNKIGMGNIMGGFKGLKDLEESAAGGILRVGDKQTAKTGIKFLDASSNKWLAFKQHLLRTPISYLRTNLDEALQENLQDISHDAVQSYYQAKYNDNKGQPVQSVADNIKDAAANQFHVQGAKTFISGFLTGAIIGPGEYAIGKSGNIGQYLKDRTGYQQRQAEIRQSRNEIIDAGNKIWKNPLNFDYRTGDVTLQANFNTILKQAARTGNKETFYDIKDDALRHFILTGIRTGALDSFSNRLKSYTEHLTPDEFTSAFGLESNAKNRDAVLAQVNQFAQRATEVQDLHDHISAGLTNPFNPYRFDPAKRVKENPEYVKEALSYKAWNDAVDNFVFTKSYYQDAVKGQANILSSLRNKPGFKDANFNDIYLLTSRDHVNAEIDNLHKEVKNLQPDKADAGSRLLSTQKKDRLALLLKYKAHLDQWSENFDEHSKLPVGEQREQAFDKSFEDFRQKATPLFGEFINQELKGASKAQITQDDILKGFDSVHNYMKLQKQSGIILDKVNLLADPVNFSKFFAEHNRQIKAAYDLSEAIKASSGPAKSTTVQITDDKGKDIGYTFTEGETYVGKLTQLEKYRGKGKTATQFNNDKIRIAAVSEDGKTISVAVNGEPAVDMDAEEIAKLAHEQKWKEYSKLSPIQRTYLSLRNKVISYRLLQRDSEGRPLKGSNGQYLTQEVKGRIKLNDKKDSLLFAYGDKTVEFNPKYVVNQQDLSELPTPEQQALKEQQDRMQRNFTTQVTIFETAYKETEARLEEQKVLTVANQEKFDKTIKDLGDLQAHLDLVIGELEKKPYKGVGRRSNESKALTELKDNLSKEIGDKNNYLKLLTQEKEELKASFDALQKAKDLYEQAFFELQDTDIPFDRGDKQDIYGAAQADLDRARGDQISKRLSDDQIETLLDDTRTEMNLLDGRISVVHNLVTVAEKALQKLSKLDDILQALADITDKRQLIRQLSMIKNQSDDAEKTSIISALIKGLNKGDRGLETQYILEKASILKAGREELAALLDKAGELQDKYDRLNAAHQQRQQIDTLQQRVDYLKEVQKTLTAGFGKILAQQALTRQGHVTRAKTVTAAQELHEFEDFMAATPIIVSDEAPFFDDVHKPRLDQIGLFKTAGRHYLLDTDPEPSSPEAARFFKFTENVIPNGAYFLQAIGASNDTYGIRAIQAYPDDIKLIVVKKEGNTYHPVGLDGTVLDNPAKDNLIFTSMHGNAALLDKTPADAIQWVRENFATKSLSDADIQQKIDAFRSFRQSVKDKITAGESVFLTITDKSIGVQAREPLDIQTKRPQELPLEGRLIASDTADWTNPKHPDGMPIRLEVSTTGSVLNKKLKAGRVALVKEDGSIFQVYNRQLNQTEKDDITEVIKLIAPLMGRRYLDKERLAEIDQLLKSGKITPEQALHSSNPLTEQEQDTFDKAIRYLMGVTYWRQGKEGQLVGKDQFRIAKGMLYRGETAIPFNPEEIEKQKDTLLEGLYHQVNNKLVGEKDAAFYELSVKGQQVTEKKWDNYMRYLMDGAGDRTAPIYTNVKPFVSKTDTQNSQLRSIYLTYGTGGESVVAAPASKSADQTAMTYTDPLRIPHAQDQQIAFIRKKLDKTTDLNVVTQWDGTKFKVVKLIDQHGQDFTDREEVRQKNEDYINGTMAALETNREVPELYDAELNAFKGIYHRIENYSEASQPAAEAAGEEKQQQYAGEEVAAASAEPVNTYTPAEIEAMVRQGISTNNTDIIDENARLALSDDPEMVENIEAFKEWMKDRLPQIPVNKVLHLINGRNWGQFIDGAIQLYQNAELGTGYHEAFEAVWNTYLTPEEQEHLINEFRERSGTFHNPFSGVTKEHTLASPYDVRELMAEEFKDYIIRDQPQLRPQSPVRNTLFRRLWNFIKRMLGLKADESEALNSQVNELFHKINKGEFANAKPVGLASEPAYRALQGNTVEFTQQVMEGVSAIFFSKLYASQQNIEALFGKGSNVKLFNDLYQQTKDALTQYFNAPINGIVKVLSERGIPTKTINAEVTKYTNGSDYRQKKSVLDRFHNEVLQEFKKYMGQFGLQFKEAGNLVEENTERGEDNIDEIEDKEQTVTNALGIRESIYVDPRNMTKSTVRLLIASLTADEYKPNSNQVQIKKNGLGLPTLEDYGRKLNILLNELQGIVPVYENGKRVETIDRMFRKLDERFKNQDGKFKPGFEWIQKLKSRLKYELNGQQLPFEHLSENEIRLLVAFESSFTNNKNLPYKLLVGEGGYLTAVDPVVVTNAAKVKELWQNSLKASSRLLKTGEDLIHAPITYVGADGKIMFNPVSDHMKKLLSASTNQTKLDSLRKLGIVFTQTDAELLHDQDATKAVAESFNGISYAFREGLINSFDDLFSKQVVNGPISQLLSIELRATAEDNILSHQNAAGKQQFSITLPSALSNIVNSLKGVDNIKDFILTNPQYGSLGTNGQVLLNPYQAGSQLLKAGGILFDRDGRKKKDIDYQFILGMSLLTDNEGDNTDDLKYPDKIVQEIYHLLNGTYYTVINSDKSSEFGLNMGHFISWQDIKKPIGDNESVTEAYKAALLDEVKAAVLEVNSPSGIQYYGDGVKFLGHFRDILQFIVKEDRNKKYSALQKQFMSQVLGGKESPEDFVGRPQVVALITDYIKNQVDVHKQYLIDLGIVRKDQVSDAITNYASNAFSQEQLDKLNIGDSQKLSDVEYTNLIKFMTINRQIGVFEQHKLLYGHPALYKDLAKRSNGINSQKESITENRQVLTWMDKHMARLDGKVRGDQELSTFRFISYQDPTAISLYHADIAEGMYESLIKDLPKRTVEQLIGATFDENGDVLTIPGGKGTYIDAYINANEPDGQAYVMMDFFRDMLYLSGKFSKEQAALWEYERAAEIIDRSNPKSDYYKAFPKQEIEQAQQLLEAGKPKGVLQTLKPQGFGYQTTEGVTHTTFLKHSVFPLTWSRVKDRPNMAGLYVKAQQGKIDVIGFESGEKVGNVMQNGGFIPIYKESGAFNTDPLPVQEMYAKYYGIQVEMAAKTKQKVIMGTQMRKLVLSNLPHELKGVAGEYFKTLEALMALDKKSLLHEIGLQQNPDGSYRTENLEGMVNTLRQEAISRDLPDNVIDMISAVRTEAGDRLAYQFDANPIREKIDNILNAIVDSRVISQKMSGKASVQVSATLWEKDPRSFMYLKDGIWTSMESADRVTLSKEEQRSVRMISADLKFYTREEPWMEIMLPHYFEGILPHELNLKDIDPQLLAAIGFRIPTQGMNSIENIRIKGFLDPSMGDIVVVPSEMVGKSGSDFDIDKLNMYLPNYTVETEGGRKVVKYVDPAGTSKEALQNRLIRQMGEILAHPDNYRQLIVPNGAETLKGLAEQIRSLKGLEKEGASLTRLSEWKTMVETRERYISGKKLVGIGALQITSHTVSQLAGVELTGTYKTRDGQELPVRIKFDHNQEAGKFYLTAVKDRGHQYISELLSEALTGFVDAAKDPFIFDLNLNLQTAATWFYLQKLGVPVKELAYLHTQPLIERYFAEQGKNESYVNKANDTELVKEMVIFKAADPYFQRAFNTTKSLYQLGLPDASGKWKTRREYFKLKEELLSKVNRFREAVDRYSESELKSNIQAQNATGYQLTKEDALKQLALLYDYLDYQQQAGYLSNFINAIAYDTAKTKNIIENRIQESTLQAAYNDNFITPESINRVFDTTFLGAVKDQKQDIASMFKDFFVSLHPNSQPAFEKVVALINNPALNMSKDKKAEVLNRYQNFFITALLHTIKFKTGNEERSLNEWYKLFFGDRSLASLLKTLQADPKYRNNPALKQMFPLINSDRSMTDNIKLFNNKLSTYEINVIAEALLNLKQQAEAENNTELSKLVGRLGIFSILQSGVQTSPITYTKILPIEIYSKIVGDILDRFTGQQEGMIDPELIWKQFFQNNWYNSTLVPRVRKFSRERSGLISIPGNFRTAYYDYISTRELKPEYGGKVNEKRDALVKQKRWDELYNYGLYERIRVQDQYGTDLTDEQPVIYYKPINRMGNRMFMTEAYGLNRESMLLGNKPFDENQYDDAVDQVRNKTIDSSEPTDSPTDLPCEGGTPF